MKKRTRTIIFAACIALFLLAAPAVVLYSQGYRFDFENRKITQTGAFYCKTFPKSAEIYLDGKLKKNTSFLTGSALIENLLPKTYQIEIKKEGFRPWQKTLEVTEKQVTEAKNIVLFPENIDFEKLIKDVERFWLSPDGKKIVLYESEETEWTLKLYELDRDLKSHLINEKDIYARGADLLDLEFSEDSKKVNLKVGMKEQEKKFVLDLSRFPPLLTEEKTPAFSESIIAFKKINNQVYYLDRLGYVFRVNSSALPPETGTGTRINRNPFPVKPETKYDLEAPSDSFIFLREKNDLYLFNPESGLLERFFDNFPGLEISPDSSKLALSSDSEIWVLFLKDKNDRPVRKTGEKIFLTRMAAKIGKVLWLNSDYLAFDCGEEIKIVETDDRDKINMVNLAKFESPEIFWNRWDKKIYVFSEGNLYRSQALLP